MLHGNPSKRGGEKMRKMTEENLKAAFAGESQAHTRYLIFAEEAKRHGFENVARLFTAIAFAELVHATNHLRALGGIGKTGENLAKAIEGETFEVDEMYPAYVEVAKLQNEKVAERSANGLWKRRRFTQKCSARLRKQLKRAKTPKLATFTFAKFVATQLKANLLTDVPSATQQKKSSGSFEPFATVFQMRVSVQVCKRA
jgi:rubrerythrin